MWSAAVALDLFSNHVFQSVWFDPLTATLGFMLSIYVYTCYEIQSGLCSTYSSFFDFILLRCKNDKDEESKSTNTTTSTSSNNTSTSHFILLPSLVAYWVGILIWIKIVPPPAEKLPLGIPDSILGGMILVAEVVSGIILYDFSFFLIHYSFHHFKALSFIGHKVHHRARGIHNLAARHVLDHSLLDGMLQVLVNISVQRYTPWGSVKSRLARTLHNLIVTWMLTESHTFSDYPNVFRRFSFCKGLREHRYHHLLIPHDTEHRIHVLSSISAVFWIP
mmetsp:Transcript_10364/g.19385  ORF Transcript_10364/g.19385 Transcript_10364/m.19385 type:complete len:277 (-) Transcript_10364:549-1379(-)